MTLKAIVQPTFRSTKGSPSRACDLLAKLISRGFRLIGPGSTQEVPKNRHRLRRFLRRRFGRSESWVPRDDGASSWASAAIARQLGRAFFRSHEYASRACSLNPAAREASANARRAAGSEPFARTRRRACSNDAIPAPAHPSRARAKGGSFASGSISTACRYQARALFTS